ncbi:MAG: MFS transporter [Brachybacterium sp.]
MAARRSTDRRWGVRRATVGIAPVLAPTLGGFVDSMLGWRAVFWILALLGVLLTGLVLTMVPESLAPQRRTPLRLGAAFSVYADFARNPRFTVPAVAMIALLGLLFAYIGGASYVYQGDYGLSPGIFGLAFGASGVAMLLATLLVSRLSTRFSAASLALTGGAVATSGALGSIVAALTGAPFPALLGSIMVLVFGLGISEPVLMGEAMNASDTGSGQAAALLGAAQFLLGAVATVIAGIVAAAGPLPWTLLLAGFAVLSLALVLLGLRATRSGAAG